MTGIVISKTNVLIVIGCLLLVLLLLLAVYVCYECIIQRKKRKGHKSAPASAGTEILEYDSLKFTYDTNIETQQNNTPFEFVDIPEDESVCSQAGHDDHQNLLKSVDFVQPLTTSSNSSSVCSDFSDIVDVELKDNVTYGLGRLPTLTSNELGRISAELFFDKTLDILRVNVIQWNNSGSKRMRPTLSPYVKVSLSPDTDNKFFTKTRRGENPVFDESFSFGTSESQLEGKALHLSLCDFDKFSRQNILGKGVLNLEDILEKLSLPEGTGELWVDLHESTEEPSENKGDISFSLSYLPTAGRITLTVVQAKDLGVDENDTSISVKVRLLFGGKVAKSQKTSYHQSDLRNPVFNESWAFDISSNALEQVSFFLCVYAYSHNKKRVIGKAIAGSQVYSPITGLAQWNEMLSQPRDPIVYWHKLA